MAANNEVDKIRVVIEGSLAPFKKVCEEAKKTAQETSQKVHAAVKAAGKASYDESGAQKTLSFLQKLRLSTQMLKADAKVGTGMFRYSDEMVGLSEELNQARKEADALQMSLKMAMIRSGGNEADESVRQIASDLVTAKHRAEQAGNALVTLANNNGLVKSTGISGYIRKTASEFGTFAKQAGQVASNALRKCAGAAQSLIHKFKNAAGSIGLFKKGLSSVNTGGLISQLLKTGIIMQALARIAQWTIQAIKYGIENLVRADPTGQANAAISRLMTSVNQLKNSLGSAFAAILIAVEPVLTKIIDLLTRAADTVGQFVAAFTGQSQYMRANAQAVNYADTLESTTEKSKKAKKAAEELKLALMGFDKINKLPDDDEEEEEPKDTVSTLTPSPAIQDTANKIRDYLKGIWDVVKKAWDQEGEALMASIRGALQSVKDLLGDIAKTFYDVFTGGYGFDWLVSVFQLLRTVFDIIKAIADAFRTAWNDNGNGYNYIASIFVMFTNINNLLRDIGRAFIDAWNSGIGVEICSNILQILTNIHMIIANLTESIRRGWNESDNGVRIWSGILGIINVVLEAINRITGATAEWAASLEFGPIMSAFATLLEQIKPLVDIIINGLAWCWENILLPLGKWTIEKALPVVLRLLGNAIEVITTALEALKPIFDPIWENVIKPFAGVVGKKVTELLGWLADRLKDLSTWISEHGEEFRTICTVVGDFVGAWLGAQAILAIIHGVSTACHALSGGITVLAAGFNPVTAAIAAAIAIGLLLWQNWDTIKEKAGELKEWLGEKWENIKTYASEKWGAIKDKISSKWEEVKTATKIAVDFVRTQASEKWEAIKTKTATIWQSVKDKVSTKWEEMKTATKNAVDDIRTKASDRWESIKSTASTKWEEIKTTLGGKWDTIKENAGKFLENIRSSAEKKWETIKGNAETGWNNVKTTVGGVWNTIKKNAGGFLEDIRDKAEKKWGTINTEASTKWNTISTTIGGIWDTIKKNASEMLDGVVDFFFNLPGRIKNAVGDLASIGSEWIGSLLSGLSEKWHEITEWVTGKLQWVKDQFSAIFSIQAPTITADNHYVPGGGGQDIVYFDSPGMMASGGFPLQGQMFVARENGPEMIGTIGGHSAVANNDQIVDGIRAGVFEAVVNAFESSGGGNSNNQNPAWAIYLDGKQMTDAVVKRVNQTTARQGKSPFRQ